MARVQPVLKYMDQSEAGGACVMCCQVSAHNMHPFLCSFVLSTLNLQAEMFQDTLVSTRYTARCTGMLRAAGRQPTSRCECSLPLLLRALHAQPMILPNTTQKKYIHWNSVRHTDSMVHRHATRMRRLKSPHTVQKVTHVVTLCVTRTQWCTGMPHGLGASLLSVCSVCCAEPVCCSSCPTRPAQRSRPSGA